MKNKINLIILFSSLLISLSFCVFPKHMEKKDQIEIKQDEDNVMIPFIKDSFNLSKDAIVKLNEYAPYVSNSIKKCYLLITPWSCFNETKKNSLIGILRSKAIIDFYEKNYSIPRTFFLINDDNHFNEIGWDKSCLGEGFVTFYFEFCNPKREN